MAVKPDPAAAEFGARTRWRIGAAVSWAALLAAAGAYDLDWVWRLARFPDNEGLFWLAQSLIEGGGTGFGDLVLLVFLATGGGYGGSLLPRAPRRLRAARGAMGYLAASGLTTLLAVCLLKLVFARPGPALVLGGVLPFSPWYLPTGLAPFTHGSLGSFPAAPAALAAACSAFALARTPPGGGSSLRTAVFSALALGGTIGAFGVYAQAHWPSDAVAGAALGGAIPWLLHRRRAGGNPPPGQPRTRKN